MLTSRTTVLLFETYNMKNVPVRYPACTSEYHYILA